MSFKKILEHPAKNSIVRMLTGGMGVRAVAKRLKEMYPDDKKLQITPVTLQKFRDKHLDIQGEFLNAIKAKKREERGGKKLIMNEKKEKTRIQNIPAYKEKLKEAIDLHIDIKQSLKDMYVLINARMEELFNRGSLSINEDQNLQKYLQAYIAVIEKWAKYVEKIADHTTETNVNVTVIEDQMSVIRECIRETFNELNPELAVKFFEKLEKKMSMLSYRPNRPRSFEEINKEVKVLVEDTKEPDAN